VTESSQTERPATSARRRPFTLVDVYQCSHCWQTVQRHDGRVFDYDNPKLTTEHVCQRHATA